MELYNLQRANLWVSPILRNPIMFQILLMCLDLGQRRSRPKRWRNEGLRKEVSRHFDGDMNNRRRNRYHYHILHQIKFR
jgi:hypothetical protein